MKTHGVPCMSPALQPLAWALAAGCCITMLGAAPHEPQAWRYVSGPAGSPHESLPLHALALTGQKPDDVVEKVTYRGRRQRYAQLRYGSPSSIRVTVVLDEAGPGDADLYVDAERNRRIEPHDRAERHNRTWHVPLDVAIVEGESTRYERRSAVFRLGSTGLVLSFAAAGYIEGTVDVGHQLHAARRVDGDGNGLLTDEQDQLWIDLNDDGRWDPLNEQFAFTSIFTLGGERYASRSDLFGHRLALEPLEGTGTVRLAFTRPGGAAELMVTMIGRDGSAVSLSGQRAAVELPVGEYRLGSVTLALDDPRGGPRWNYVFSDNGRRAEARWLRVEKDRTLAVDPIGALELVTGAEGLAPVRAGEELTVRPALYTADGLLIVTGFRGSPAAPSSETDVGAMVKLATTDGRALATAHSGFV